MENFDCPNCRAPIPDWKKDYGGMREFQAKFIDADHKWRAHRKALMALKRGDCLCEMAIGNPMILDHSEGCKLAQELLGEK